MNEIKTKLVAMEAQIDEKLFAAYRGPDGRYYQDQGEDGSLLKTGAAGVGVGAAGYGAFKADQAIMGKYGRRNLLPIGDMEPGSPRSIAARTAAPLRPTFGNEGPLHSTAVGRKEAYKSMASSLRNKAESGVLQAKAMGQNVGSRIGGMANEVASEARAMPNRLARVGRLGTKPFKQSGGFMGGLRAVGRILSGGRLRFEAQVKQRLLELTK